MKKPVLVQLDPRQYRDLQRLIPSSTRKRSEFIRNAIELALLRLKDERTRLAYEKYPDDREEEPFDPADWAPESEAIHPEDWAPATQRKRSRRPVAQKPARPRSRTKTPVRAVSSRRGRNR